MKDLKTKFKAIKLSTVVLVVAGISIALASGYVATQIVLVVPFLYSILRPVFLGSLGLTNILWWSDGKILFMLTVDAAVLFLEYLAYKVVKHRR
jgi:hypothetical protein